MNRPGPIALAFVLCTALALAALTWMSATVLRLDAAESEARRRAAVEENVRLALWRIDSAVTPLLAQENARPSEFYFPGREPSGGEGTVMQRPGPAAPPLEWNPYVRFHFQVSPEGTLTSPEVAGKQKDRNAMNDLRRDSNGDLRRYSDIDPWRDLAMLVEPKALLAAAPPAPALAEAAALDPLPQTAALSTQSRGVQEFQARTQNVGLNNALSNASQAVPRDEQSVRTGLFAPTWRGEQLLLVRRASIGRETYLQGCWLDWPRLADRLQNLVRDLLPAARLAPARSGAEAEPTRLLASLPVELDPGALRGEPDAGLSPLRLSLLAAWACAVLAGAAVAVLLVGVVKLSERRAAFVSAVTHELRTPLTTFRLYSEMLAEEMVSDAEQRRQYLTTLRREAERLSRLVENVLAYARLERGGTGAHRETLSLEKLLARIEPRLRERAEQGGMEWLVEAEETALSAQLHTDPSAVEQIVFNLVDNACKYAAAATDRRIHLKVRLAEGAAWLCIADHGPGVSPKQAKRLFQPFSKSAEEAARSAPGVGLGLALSRRIARELGGDLRLEAHPSCGARFVLSLPATG